MAKINARGARQVGNTLYTEFTRPASAYDVERVYYEAYRLRSDCSVLTRIISTRPAAKDSIAHETKHSSGFRIIGKLGPVGVTPSDNARLRAWLEGRGYTIVKEAYHP